MTRLGRLQRLDRLQLLLAGMLLVLGLMTVFSASTADFRRQLLSLVLAVGAYALAAAVDYRRLERLILPAYGFCLLLLLAVHFAGNAALGAQRWISIAGFPLEPSELSKVIMLLVLARHFAVRPGRERELRTVVEAIALAVPPLVLILTQPDLGTAMVFAALLAGMLFLGGSSRLHLVGLGAICAIAAPILPHLLHGYQKQRLEIFLNPMSDPLGAGYNLLQARIAVGSGGLLGHGWLHGLQGSLGFVPERATDFIFAVYAEQFGLIGSAVLIGVFTALMLRLCWSASVAPDRFGYLLCSGVAVMLCFQVVENIGMNVGLTPIAGIPLPLISYGGSALVANLAALGAVQSVMLRRRLLVYRQASDDAYLLNESGTVRLDPGLKSPLSA
ncbi:MAG TPA: rod shape-determining protein RodA [Candidatus Dormibacteraeota bacterium]|nr:rod shape-determining protein RodA [Candidatus Dormibacteraeota bacterium]